MRRGFFITLSVAILLPATPIMSFDQAVQPGQSNLAKATISFSYYYGENGKLIDSVRSDISKTYVIRTSQRPTKFYQSCELNRSCLINSEDTAVALQTIKATSKRVIDSIKLGNIHSAFVQQHVVEILSKELLRTIRKNILDNGKGEKGSANNREFGGVVYKNDSVTLVAGPVANPATENAHISLPSAGVAEYHSHPSGTLTDDTLKRANDEVIAKSEPVSRVKRTYQFMQGPTTTDQRNVGKRQGYVFAMGLGKIIIYDCYGIVTSLPIDFAE